MKVKNKIFVFALILSLIFAVSTVVAAEDMTFDQSELKEVSTETEDAISQEDTRADEDNKNAVSNSLSNTGGGRNTTVKY